MSVVLSPTPPVECLSTLTPLIPLKSALSPESRMASVRATVSALVIPRKNTAMANAEPSRFLRISSGIYIKSSPQLVERITRLSEKSEDSSLSSPRTVLLMSSAVTSDDIIVGSALIRATIAS